MTNQKPGTGDDGGSIPLYDGPPTQARIITDTEARGSDGQATQIRQRRRGPRHTTDNVTVCLSVHDASGRMDHCECPLVDMSAEGASVIFDRVVTPGVRCYVSYRTVSHQPVHLGGTVRNCERVGPLRHRVGIRFDRTLGKEEQRPAKRRGGHSVSPLHHARSLRQSECERPFSHENGRQSVKPHVIAPPADGDAATYDLTGD